MAISTNQKVDFLFKKIGYGVADTDSSQSKSASNESVASPLLIRGDNIWVSSGAIPLIPPAVTDSIIRVYMGATAVKTAEDLTATTRRTWKTGSTNWIGTEFGAQYQLRVYVDSPTATDPASTGTRLFADGSGNNDAWFFDYQSGILRFPDTNIPAGVSQSSAIFVEGYRYVGATGLPSSVTDSKVSTQLSSLSNVSVSGSYNDLTDTPTLVSAFTNDASYVTTAELSNVAANVPTNISSLVNDANFATTSYVNTSISNLVGNAPALLDTLTELSNAIGDDPSFINTITATVALKANTADLANVATSGAYGDLTGTPTIPADVSDLTDSTNLLNHFSGAYEDLTGSPVLANVATTGSYNDLRNTPVETYTFYPSLVWTVIHNRNTLNIMESLFDENNKKFYAQVNIIDANSFEVVLTEATAGRVTVFFA